MSTIVTAACWPIQIPPTQKSVLISLADNANDHGVCWPALDTIQMRTCLARSTVIEAIKWLEQHGLLAAQRVPGKSTRYQVIPNGLAPQLFDSTGSPSVYRTGPRGRPVQQVDGSVSWTRPAERADPSGSRTQPVQQPDPNRKEPSEEATKKGRASAPARPDGVAEQTWADWLALRKAKRAPVTETVLNHAIAEAAKAGMSLNRFLEIWCARGSQGLQAGWLTPEECTTTPVPRGTPNAAHRPGSRESTADRVRRFAIEGEQRDAVAAAPPDLVGADG